MESFTPRSIISGRVKATRDHPADAACAAAAAVLGTDKIALVHSRTGDVIWFLAAPAVDLASHVGSTAPLAAALPGTKGHQGDGAYTVNLANGWQAVIVKQGDALHSFVGTAALANRFTAQQGGARASYACAGPGLPWQFPAEVSQRREARLKTAITVSGLGVAVLAAGIWLWAAHGVSQQDELRDALRQDHLNAWMLAVRSLEPPPYPKALADLQKAIAQASQQNGVLVKFEHQQGRSGWTLNVNDQLVTGASN